MATLAHEQTSVRRSPAAAPQMVDAAGRADVIRRVLVATDGSGASDGAVRFAELIAKRGDFSTRLVSVLEPVGRVFEPPLSDAVLEQVERRLTGMRCQVHALTGARVSWPTAVNIGPVGETIARFADTDASDLVIVGFGRHRRVSDRPPEKATVRTIAEQSAVPVLVVPSHIRTLPTRAMLALDFSRSSLRAARAALQVMGDTGVMHLVYVHANNEPFPAEPADPDATYRAGFDAFFDAVEDALKPPAGVRFEWSVMPGGDPVDELLAYAANNGIELIAVGNHGKSMHERTQLGSVSTGILRSAQCSVLVAGSADAGA